MLDKDLREEEQLQLKSSGASSGGSSSLNSGAVHIENEPPSKKSKNSLSHPNCMRILRRNLELYKVETDTMSAPELFQAFLKHVVGLTENEVIRECNSSNLLVMANYIIDSFELDNVCADA
jgi:hypothetical protein